MLAWLLAGHAVASIPEFDPQKSSVTCPPGVADIALAATAPMGTKIKAAEEGAKTYIPQLADRPLANYLLRNLSAGFRLIRYS